MTDKLTPKQQAFVEEYMIDLNATQAAIRAGYSPRTAEVQGPRLLGNVRVSAAIAELKEARSERLQIDADWVLRRAVEVYRRVTQEIRPALDRNGQQLYDDGGSPLYKFDAAAALRALELVGRHVEVGAFEERVSVTHGLVERIIGAQHRVAGEKVEDAHYTVVPPKPVRTLPPPVPSTPKPTGKSATAKPTPEPERRRGDPNFRPNRYVAPSTGQVVGDFDPFEPKGT